MTIDDLLQPGKILSVNYGGQKTYAGRLLESDQRGLLLHVGPGPERIILAPWGCIWQVYETPPEHQPSVLERLSAK